MALLDRPADRLPSRLTIVVLALAIAAGGEPPRSIAAAVAPARRSTSATTSSSRSAAAGGRSASAPTGLRVVTDGGAPVGLRASLIRNVFRLLERPHVLRAGDHLRARDAQQPAPRRPRGGHAGRARAKAAAGRRAARAAVEPGALRELGRHRRRRRRARPPCAPSSSAARTCGRARAARWPRSWPRGCARWWPARAPGSTTRPSSSTSRRPRHAGKCAKAPNMRAGARRESDTPAAAHPRRLEPPSLLTCRRHASRAQAARGTGGCTTSVGSISLQPTPRPARRRNPMSQQYESAPQAPPGSYSSGPSGPRAGFWRRFARLVRRRARAGHPGEHPLRDRPDAGEHRQHHHQHRSTSRSLRGRPERPDARQDGARHPRL